VKPHADVGQVRWQLVFSATRDRVVQALADRRQDPSVRRADAADRLHVRRAEVAEAELAEDSLAVQLVDYSQGVLRGVPESG
jgi:hypothetical protein